MHVGRYARRSILDVANDPRSAIRDQTSLEKIFYLTRLRLNRIDMRILFMFFHMMKDTCIST